MPSVIKPGVRKALSRFAYNISRIEQKYSRMRPSGIVVDLVSMQVVPDENMASVEDYKAAVARAEKILGRNEFGEAHISAPVCDLTSQDAVEKCQRVNSAFEKQLKQQGVVQIAEKGAEDFESHLEREEENVRLVCRKRRIEAVDDGKTKKLKLSQEEHFVDYRRNSRGGLTKEITQVHERLTIQPDESRAGPSRINTNRINLMIDDRKSLYSEALSEDHYEKQLAKLKSGSFAFPCQILPSSLFSMIQPFASKTCGPSNHCLKVPERDEFLRLAAIQPRKPLKALEYKNDKVSSNVESLPRTKSKLALLLVNSDVASQAGVRGQCKPRQEDTVQVLKGKDVAQNSSISKILCSASKKTSSLDHSVSEVPVRDYPFRNTPTRTNQVVKRYGKGNLRSNFPTEDKWLSSWLADASKRTEAKDFEEDKTFTTFDKNMRRLECSARIRNTRLKEGFKV